MLARTKLITAAAALTVAALLAGCGGGDDSGPSTGGWVGTSTSNRDVTAVVLSDGGYYLMYSAVGDPNTVGGVVQGTASISSGAFTSSDALDFNVEGAGMKPGAVAASLHPYDKFEGGFTPATTGNALSFQTRFDFAKSLGGATLAQLAGAYNGNAGFALGVRPAVFTVTATGAVSSSINGCAITGTATPRTDINGYDLTIAFGPAPCAIPNLSFTGIAYIRQDNGRLYAAARNAATKQSVIFSGSKV